jgi:autotransporter passenger strand-loop-strand repeat protein
MTVDAGGTTTSVSLVGSDSSGDGGREILLGSARFTTLSASAQLIVSSGGVAIGTVVNSRTGPLNGGMTVLAGGQASGTTINSGGFEFVHGADTSTSAQ